MAYSLYDATIPMAKGAIKSLQRIIAEAEKHPDSSQLIEARLIEDMKPLSFQVHYATFQAQALAARLSGQTFDEPERKLDSYAKLRESIEEALRALDAAEKDTVNELGEAMTTYPVRDTTIEVPVKGIVGNLNMPNIYFHVAMTYAILRKEGVPVGKRDWTRPFLGDYI
jgi:uncharacterized protein